MDEKTTNSVSGEKTVEKTHATETAENVKATEHGGPEGPEPTRYGDWEKKGRCIDF
ncbi:MAG: DUF1674 domain-containing protein [Rhodospirillales bacterium]|nr:DUF1674 domain-containing protein [Rhodospirillales bacterium]